MELLELGRALRERRESIGIPKAEIARRVEISEGYVAMVEQGSRRPSKAVLERWAAALGWNEVYTQQLLTLAGHIAQEQDSTPSPRLPFAASALHFPQPRRMEKERVIQEILGVLNRAEAYEKVWQETLELLESFVEWLKFRLEEQREIGALAERGQRLSFAKRLYLQITGPASEVKSIFEEITAGNLPGLEVAVEPRESTSIFTRQTHGYEVRVSGTVEFAAPVAERLAHDYVKRLIETRFPQSRIEVKVSEDVENF
jgi:transcriptional regulator with XRE-family HTH domain